MPIVASAATIAKTEFAIGWFIFSPFITLVKGTELIVKCNRVFYAKLKVSPCGGNFSSLRLIVAKLSRRLFPQHRWSFTFGKPTPSIQP
jgi:hypothetical protein